jgi:hypothetical protein
MGARFVFLSKLQPSASSKSSYLSQAALVQAGPQNPAALEFPASRAAEAPVRSKCPQNTSCTVEFVVGH